MAQIVGYYENDIIYTEGPFVMVNANGWRIEVQSLVDSFSVCPNSFIYKLLDDQGLERVKCNEKEKIEKSVDWLNKQVRKGTIIRGEWGWEPVSHVIKEPASHLKNTSEFFRVKKLLDEHVGFSSLIRLLYPDTVSGPDRWSAELVYETARSEPLLKILVSCQPSGADYEEGQNFEEGWSWEIDGIIFPCLPEQARLTRLLREEIK